LINYRKKLIEVVRLILNLPTRAASHIIFASRKVGGLAFQDPLAKIDIQSYQNSSSFQNDIIF
jgi:hypothetical protein